jgi:hypothetical protein
LKQQVWKDILMKLALQLNNYVWDGGPGELGDTLANIARSTDEHGFSTILEVIGRKVIPEVAHF